jgi:phage terminase large subunit-like protein
LSPVKDKARDTTISVDYHPHPKQMEVLRSSSRFKVIAWGRRTGKTEIEAIKGLFGDAAGLPGAVKGSKVWWVAPDYPRARIGWELAQRFAQPIPEGLKRTSQEEKKISFPYCNGFFQVKSGFDPASLRGEGLDHVTMDESAFMNEDVWVQAIRPALADRRGSADFISTPQGFNFFYDLYERGERRENGEWESFHGTSYDNPHVADEEIEAARRDYVSSGLEHIFRQEFLAEFLEGSGIPIFQRKWWEGINRYDQNDERMLRKGRGWWIAADTGNKDKIENAQSVFVVGQLMPNYDLLIREVVYGRWTFDQLPGIAVQLARRYRGHYMNSLRFMPIEDAASGTALIQTLKHSGPGWLRGKVAPVKAMPKEINWTQAAVWCARGFVKLPYPDDVNAHWLMPFENQLFNVSNEMPKRQLVDMADAFSILVNWVKMYFAAVYGRGAGMVG